MKSLLVSDGGNVAVWEDERVTSRDEPFTCWEILAFEER